MHPINNRVDASRGKGALQFKDGSFDVVVDKGGLDALMGEDSPESQQAGVRLLAEVKRVLAPHHGVYCCVTLAQPHVLSAFLPPLWTFPSLHLLLRRMHACVHACLHAHACMHACERPCAYARTLACTCTKTIAIGLGF